LAGQPLVWDYYTRGIMPEIISCPECGRKLRVKEDLFGRKVKCPDCGVTFTAGGDPEDSPAPKGIRKPAARPPEERIEEKPRRRPAPVAADEEEDEPPRDRRYEEDDEGPLREPRGNRDAWARVRSGVTLVLVAIFTAILSIAVFIAGVLLIFRTAIGNAAQAQTREGAEAATEKGLTGLKMFLGFFVLGVLGSLVMQMIGYFFCMAVPPKKGAKGLAIATFCLATGSLALSVLGDAILFLSENGLEGLLFGGGIGRRLQPVANLMSLAGFIIFLLFLRNVALALKSHGLASSIATLMVTGAIFFVGIVSFAVMTLLASGSSSSAAVESTGLLAGLCACGNILLGLVWFVWYIVTLFQVRGVIDSYVSRY
jgi:predicted Zn finger-like uncharacterized protein